MPELMGVLETSLYVNDLERSAEFYRELFDFAILVADRRMCALSVPGRGVLLLFKKGGSAQAAKLPGGTIPPHDGDGNLHVAFAIPAHALPAWEGCLEQRDIPIESRVAWPRGGTSVYFRDPDDHLIEIATPGVWKTY